MRSLFETLQQISLGLFVNGTYGLMQSDIDVINIAIVGFSVSSMFLLNSILGALNGR